MTTPLLVINIVGLTAGSIGRLTPSLSRFARDQGVRRLLPPLPAVTCTSQATLTTGTLPAAHGIVSNGWYFRESSEVQFWKRSDRLVQGEKIWETLRRQRPDARSANLFWRFCTHAACDWIVTERPTYWADGRKGPDIFSQPAILRGSLVERFGDFPLFRFWGPATSIESTRWIADATAHILKHERPELILTYLPHLDYDLQKFGPRGAEAERALAEVDTEAGRLLERAAAEGYDVALVSEYGITPVTRPVYLNRVLRRAGLLEVHHARNGELLEAGISRAFAACSHQVAHVYVHRPSDLPLVRELLEATPGVDQVLDKQEQLTAGLAHERSGEFVCIAAADAWFAYPYWLEDGNAPDFAHCVAIHDKPGHDPVEMFLREGALDGKLRVLCRLSQKLLGLRAPFDVVSTDTTRIGGSHGRPPEREDDHPILVTSWPLDDTLECLPMTAVKGLLLDRMLS